MAVKNQCFVTHITNISYITGDLKNRKSDLTKHPNYRESKKYKFQESLL